MDRSSPSSPAPVIHRWRRVGVVAAWIVGGGVGLWRAGLALDRGRVEPDAVVSQAVARYEAMRPALAGETRVDYFGVGDDFSGNPRFLFARLVALPTMLQPPRGTAVAVVDFESAERVRGAVERAGSEVVWEDGDGLAVVRRGRR